MLDRQQLEVLLANRFPGATADQIAAAANAIMGLARADYAGRPPLRPAVAQFLNSPVVERDGNP